MLDEGGDVEGGTGGSEGTGDVAGGWVTVEDDDAVATGGWFRLLR